jgi:chromosome segregation ATPase
LKATHQKQINYSLKTNKNMKRIPIVIFLTALVIGLILLLGTCSDNPQTSGPDKVAIEKTEKQVSSIDTHYQNAISQLQKHSDSLQSELIRTQEKLKIVKFKLNQSQFNVVRFVKKDTVGESIAQQMNDCDSLKQEVEEYVQYVDSTKIIYESNISELQTLVATKDSELVVCKSSYENLQNIVAENLQRERQLTDDLQTAFKQQRKKVIQNKLLAGGFLLLSGLTTTLFIKANK